MTDFLDQLKQKATEAAEKGFKYVEENPGKTSVLALSSITLIAPGLVAAPALGLLGFTSQGVAAGSIAAGIQAGIGNVAAGSTFAVLQGAGAGGAGAAIVNGIVQVAGLGLAGVAAGNTAKTVVKVGEK